VLRNMLATAMASAVMALGVGAHAGPAAALTEENLIYLEAWRAVYQAYVDGNYNGQNWFKLKEQTLKSSPMRTRGETYDAIRSTLATLDDPYTKLLEPSQFSVVTEKKSGSLKNLSGIGIEIETNSDASSPGKEGFYVLSTQPGSPADVGGIAPGDVVIGIDHHPASSLSLYEAAIMLQGPAGSQVSLDLAKPHHVKGGGSKTKGSDLVSLTLTRQVLRPSPSVTPQLCAAPHAGNGEGPAVDTGETVGYIRLSTFSDGTANEVRSAVEGLLRDGAKRFVIDLRDNGGGSFAAGVDVARVWIDSGVIVNIADKQGITDYYEARGSAADASSPVTVLINGGTASAAEVLAAALKDNGRATALMGDGNSFGKGLIQTLVPLSDGSGVSVSVAKYQTPKGVDINGEGITPDVVTRELPSPNMGREDKTKPCLIVEATDRAFRQ